MSRPPRDLVDRRDERLRFRVTIVERLLIEECAKRAGMSVSEFLRDAALKPPRTHAKKTGSTCICGKSGADRQLLNELIRHGNNLNQMTRAANRGRMPPPEAVTRLCGLIEAILRDEFNKQ